MSHARSRLTLVSVVMAHLVLLAPSASAETSTARAKRHNQAAERLFNLGLFEQAAQEYQEAYRAKPVPDFLYNLAQCYRRLDTVQHLERALFYFRSYLRNARGTALQKQVERLMVRTQQRLEELLQKTAPPASSRAAAPSPVPAPPTSPPTSKPLLAASPLVAPLAAPPASRSVAPRSTPFYKRWWFWTVVGGVMTAAAVTSTAVVLSRNSGTVEGSLSPGIMKVHAP